MIVIISVIQHTVVLISESFKTNFLATLFYYIIPVNLISIHIASLHFIFTFHFILNGIKKNAKKN